MTAVGPAALAVSRSPPGARARGERETGRIAPRILSCGRHSGRVRRKLARTTFAVDANEVALIRVR